MYFCEVLHQRDVIHSPQIPLSVVIKRTYRLLLLVLVGITHSITVQVAGSSHRGLDMCEPIEIPLCMGMPYNMTRMPNHLHHSTQENARLAIEPYGELVKQNCSADLLFFLCAMFAPICTPHFQKEAIPPCRSVCERSRQGCEPLMNKYNFSWPDDLDCNLLPEYDKGVCVSPEAIVSSMPEDGKNEADIPNSMKHVSKTDCKCNGRNTPSKNNYKKRKYDYAIGAIVKRVTRINDNSTVIRVKVNNILLRGKVHLQENREIDLWTFSECVCPPLKINREYLIIGNEEVLFNRLKLNKDSLVSRWSRKWEAKFKKWNKKRKPQKGKKKEDCNISCKKNKPKTRLKCQVEQRDESRTRLKCISQSQGVQANSLKKRKNNRKRGRNSMMTNVTKK